LPLQFYGADKLNVRWTVVKKIDIKQESQDTASQLADNVYHLRKQQKTAVNRRKLAAPVMAETSFVMT